jgi:beta-galactosidase
VPEFALGGAASLWSELGPPQHVDRPRGMETFGQSYGYILYRTGAPGPARADLVVKDVRDYAQVYVNGALVGVLDRRLSQDRLSIDIPAGNAVIDLLVENSGRVNFAAPLRDERKGITTSVTLGDRELTNWDVFTLPMSSLPRPTFGTASPAGPAFYRGTFDVTTPADTFLDTRRWGKGAVWINGHHLGRFWSIGPQQTLYVPGVWLRRGTNEVVVFDLEVPEARTMRGLAQSVFR